MSLRATFTIETSRTTIRYDTLSTASAIHRRFSVVDKLDSSGADRWDQNVSTLLARPPPSPPFPVK
jgi:hypothetical protein